MQRYWVIQYGTYRAQRWDDESGINLHHCAGNGCGFFVELGIEDGCGRAVVLRSFSSSEVLADDAHGCGRQGNKKAPA